MKLEGRTFRMWAVRRYNDYLQETFYWGLGNKFYAELYSDIDNEPVVEVDVNYQ